MKYLNAIYLTMLLLVMLSGCGGMSDQEAIDRLNQIQSGANNQDVKVETKNLCQGETDKKHMFGSNLEFAKNVQDSVKISGFSAYLDKGDFKKKYPEMTDGCIGCFEELTACAANYCGVGICAGGLLGPGADSRQCKVCNHDHCRETMFKCSGVIFNDIPSLHQK